MRRALLVTDLEGLPTVTSIDALLGTTGAHLFARGALTQAVNAVARGLASSGFERVRVFDSHQNGTSAANVVRDALHPDVELVGAQAAFTEALFHQVDAVACLGMHAPAGATGFAAHTFNLAARWRLGDRLVSEAELLLDLAAERGLPFLFVSGKPGAASVPVFGEASLDALEALARTSRPRPAPRLPPGPLTLDFHTRACAEAAERTGARRLGSHAVSVDAATSHERYERACASAEAAWEVLAPAIADGPPSWTAEDVSGLLALPWEPMEPLGALAHRSLTALRADTADGSDASRALWAITLHLLQGIAPPFFAAHGLEALLAAALDTLPSIKRSLEPSLGPDVLEARFDATYLEWLHGRRSEVPRAEAVRAALEGLEASGFSLHAWLLGELGARFGVDERRTLGPREFRGTSRVLDLYQLTHLVLLTTDYLARPPAHPDAATWSASLVAAAPLVLAMKATDLAGELVIALVALGEAKSPVVSHLLEMLAGCLEPDGHLVDPTGERGPHPTAVALVALAAAETWYMPVAENSQGRSAHVRSPSTTHS